MKIDYPKNKTIAVAVSGGVDSMVLLSLFLKEGVRPVVVTVDHGIRGEESQADAQFVQQYCKDRGLVCYAYTVDVPGEQSKSGLSTELQARELRYRIFERILAEGLADVVALAHHLSDQTETVLMRLIRGTGIGGLKGIEDRAGYIHPLLNYTREEIERYAFQNSIPFREDKTNLWDGHTRNFIRNRILPIFRQRCPQMERQVQKLIESAKETEEFIEGFLLKSEPYYNGIRFGSGIFSAHNAVIKRSVLTELKTIGVFQDVEEKSLNAICGLKGKPTDTAVDIGNKLVARREYDTLVIEPQTEPQFYKSTFSVSKLYIFGYRYVFESTDTLIQKVTLDRDKVPKGALIRTRKEGDKFKRYGGGTKSLSDYFTDKKLTKHERDEALLLADGSTILAVLGDEISDLVKVDENTKRMIKIKRSDL